ncbi:MAG TPA: exodeoxyribonuclease VII small subunit [bacterium]|nr:exodeoxyribonuclease VII small subunit [bacterium]
MTKEKRGSKKSFSFETEMERLEKIVKDMESGDLSLEQSISSFEQGIRIYRECRQYLEAARQRIEVIMGRDESGRPVIEPYEEDVDEDDEDDEQGRK